MQKTKKGWKIRNVSYAYIHKIDPKDTKKLIDSLELKNNIVIGDFMCGYGELTKSICEYVKKKRLKNITIVMSDLYPEQLKRSKEHLTKKIIGNVKIKKIVRDIRNLKFPSESFDRVVVKMGIHEIPKSTQQKAMNEVYRVLKKGGIFSIWDVMPKTKEEQILFQKVIRKKDELAGFESFVRERYLLREEEIREYLKKAGFKKIKLYHQIKYRLETHKRLEQEFNCDINRLKKWNNYIRRIIPPSMRIKIKYKDEGHTIGMTFRKGIIRAIRGVK